MNMYLTLCDFINSWFGTSFGKPSKRFRKREFYKGQYYPKKFIIALNQHLLLHQFLHQDKHLEAWDNIPAVNLVDFLKEETL